MYFLQFNFCAATDASLSVQSSHNHTHLFAKRSGDDAKKMLEKFK